MASDTWNESIPTNANLANEIDDYMRDIKGAVSGRMDLEHLWPTSQSATNESGLHRYVTLKAQTGAPGLVVGTNTQMAAIWVSSGSKHVLVEDSAGTSRVLFVSGLGVNLSGGQYSATGTQGDLLIGTTAGIVKVLAGSTDGFILRSHSNTGDAAWGNPSALVSTILDYGSSASVSSSNDLSALKICRGSLSVNGDSTTNITNLPFTDATSYKISVSYAANFTNDDGYAGGFPVDGGTASLVNQQGSARVIHWLAIGI